MMIGSIGTLSTTSQGTSQKLTEAQGEKLNAVLSSYDAKNLSGDDAKELVSQIRELGISQGSGLAAALGEAGIDAKELGEQAGVGGPPKGGGPGGPPPPGDSAGRDSVDDSVVSLIAEVVEAYEASETTDSLWSLLEPALQEAGYDTSESSIDFYS